MLNKKPCNTLLKTLALKLLLAPTMVLALILISSFSFAQSSPTVIEVKDEEELKDLKALDHEAQRLLNESKICKTTAQDYKQECLCNKHEEYLEFYKKTNKILDNPSRSIWFRAILSYEDNGQTKRTSLARFKKIALDFDQSCFRNDDGTFRANHEWDKPELLIKDAEEIKELHRLYSARKKIGLAISKCIQSKLRTYEECQCGYKEKTLLLIKSYERLGKDHPEWMDHILVYSHDGYIIKTGLEQEIRMAKQEIPSCKE